MGKPSRLCQDRGYKCAVLDGSQKSFDCSPCGESFECESKLEKHLKKSHSENKTLSGVPPNEKDKGRQIPEC